jgi:flagellar biosynthetic protein FliP
MKKARCIGLVAVASCFLFCLTGCTEQTISIPDSLLGAEGAARGGATAVQLLVLLTVLSLAPAMLTMITGFTRIVIVLSFVRSAIGTPATPPNQIIIGLSLILTFFVMAPAWNIINEEAVQPYLDGQVSQEQAYQRAIVPIRDFMLRQTREKDLSLFIHLGRLEQPDAQVDIPTYVLLPAFVLSELRAAFQMGFVIFVPFLVIDMVIASTLMSMGMMMLPPSLISMPFKILLFVMVDGWHLVIRSLVESFG